ncbi:hypothetical protein [Fluviicola taffensis]|uniref:hypothetical protein n=1 Tax=Fluviicola taffensis TaxID=191579 RepID=UPI00313841FE
MSIFTPKAELFYQDGSTPKHYCVVASFKEIEVYGFITVSDVQSLILEVITNTKSYITLHKNISRKDPKFYFH